MYNKKDEEKHFMYFVIVAITIKYSMEPFTVEVLLWDKGLKDFVALILVFIMIYYYLINKIYINK